MASLSPQCFLASRRGLSCHVSQFSIVGLRSLESSHQMQSRPKALSVASNVGASRGSLSTRLSGPAFVDRLGAKGFPQPDKNARTSKGSRRVVVRAGLPVVSNIPVLGPLLNVTIFNPVLLTILYLIGASRFWSGFKRTTYSDSAPTKFALAALWPALFLASNEFRANFKKAVQ